MKVLSTASKSQESFYMSFFFNEEDMQVLGEDSLPELYKGFDKFGFKLLLLGDEVRRDAIMVFQNLADESTRETILEHANKAEKIVFIAPSDILTRLEQEFANLFLSSLWRETGALKYPSLLSEGERRVIQASTWAKSAKHFMEEKGLTFESVSKVIQGYYSEKDEKFTSYVLDFIKKN